MSSFFKKQQVGSRGFSLIEILIYLAITVMVSLAGVTTFLSLDTVLLRNQTERVLTRAATVSLDRLLHDIREADAVNTGLSTLDVSNGVLALTNTPTTTTFAISGGNLVVSVNGVELGPLTGDDVVVQDVVFSRYVSGGATSTELVRVALTLSASSKAASSTKTFYTSAVLRGSYE